MSYFFEFLVTKRILTKFNSIRFHWKIEKIFMISNIEQDKTFKTNISIYNIPSFIIMCYHLVEDVLSKRILKDTELYAELIDYFHIYLIGSFGWEIQK